MNAIPCRIIALSLTMLSLAACQGPMGGDLDADEASLAAQGAWDERQEDGTAGDIATDSLTADVGAPDAVPNQRNGLGSDPFFLSGEQRRASTLLNMGNPPGAAAILEPSAESENGATPADPGQADMPPM